MKYGALSMWRALLALMLAAVLSAPAAGQEKGDETKADTPAEAKPEKPANGPVHKVAAEDFRIVVEAKGYLEPERVHEVKIELETWKAAGLEVVRAARHGQPVKRGDVLLVLDSEDLDDAIVEAKAEAELSRLSLQQAKRELEALEKTVPMDLAAADRAKRHAADDYEYYRKVARPAGVDDTKYSIERAEQRLAYEREELEQLKKMYDADDITEETEEIILQRQRDSVEAAERSLANARRAAERTLDTVFPRQDIGEREKVTRAAIAHETARVNLPVQRRQKEINLAKAERAHEKTTKKVADLTRDRKRMEVTAPADGVVYFGPHERGQWKSAAALKDQLKREGEVKPDTVLMTVVQPRPLVVHLSIPEDKLRFVRPGTPAKITPTAFPDDPLTGRVREVETVPSAPGSFEALVRIEGEELPEAVVAGMGCRVEIVAYEKEDALTVPVAAVHREDGDAGKRFVYVKTEEGPQKRSVVVGRSDGEKVEIRRGVSEGDEVLLEKP